MRGLLFLLFFFPALAALAQQRLFNVTAASTGTGVVIDFTIGRGPMCQGYRILHRADSLSPFSTVIDKGSEICGEQMNDQYKREIHTSPAQERTNYYVVQIDHPREQSAIIPVYVSAKGLSPMTIYPNPAYPPHTSVQLSVVPAKDMELFGYLYDRFGTRLETLDLRVTGGRTSLPVSGMRLGVYVIWLTDGENVFSGKLILVP